MIKSKTIIKKFVSFVIVLTIFIAGIYSGIGVVEVYGAVSNAPTIRMGDNAPMTRNEFAAWSSQRGVRHFNIEGRIYPVEIFFNWANGKSFSYGELAGGILHVVLRTNVVSGNNTSGTPDVNANAAQSDRYYTPVIFDDITPILFSYDELTAMIKAVPHQNPLDIRSAITLPNRRLTEAERDAWIDEYNEMGGVTAFELAVVREINRVRGQHGLRPLALDPVLMLSARLKTQEFGDLQYQAHISPGHGRPAEAVRMFGFEGSGVSETFTQSGSSGTVTFRATPEGIVRGMLASTRGHREILLNPNLYSVGFGAFFSPYSTGRNNNMSHMFYFVTKFGFNN